jgi:hypothetical protein
LSQFFFFFVWAGTSADFGYFNYGPEKLSLRKLSLAVVFPVEDLALWHRVL